MADNYVFIDIHKCFFVAKLNKRFLFPYLSNVSMNIICIDSNFRNLIRAEFDQNFDLNTNNKTDVQF